MQPDPADHRPPLDYSAGAEYLGTSVRHLRALVYRGEIPYTKLGPRLVRFLPDELDAWLEERTTRVEAS